MKKIIAILVLFISAKGFSQTENNFMQKNTFWDSVYFKNIIRVTDGLGFLTLDTLVGSPTFGKLTWVRPRVIQDFARVSVALTTTGTSGAATYNNTTGIFNIPDYSGSSTNIYNTDGTLTGNRTVTQGTNALNFTGTAAISTSLINVTNVGGGNAIVVNANGNGAGVAINYTGTTSPALETITTNSSGGAMSFIANPSSTNSIVNIGSYKRQTSGTAANGIGGDIAIQIEADDGTNYAANRIVSKLQNADDANLTSQYLITGYSKAVQDTLLALGGYVSLTESSATKFTSTTIATGKIQGGSILVTIEANDATDYQSRTLRFIWSAVNKAGTLTITISTPEEVVALSSGTLTCTITAVDAGSGVLDFKANAVSSLTQSTLRATYQTFKNF